MKIPLTDKYPHSNRHGTQMLAVAHPRPLAARRQRTRAVSKHQRPAASILLPRPAITKTSPHPAASEVVAGRTTGLLRHIRLLAVSRRRLVPANTTTMARGMISADERKGKMLFYYGFVALHWLGSVWVCISRKKRICAWHPACGE